MSSGFLLIRWIFPSCVFIDMLMVTYRVDATKPGHIIGQARSKQAAEQLRSLGAVQTVILRNFLHLAMYIGVRSNAQVKGLTLCGRVCFCAYPLAVELLNIH